MRWMIRFGMVSLGGIAAVLLVLWGMNGFHRMGLDGASAVALVLGGVATSGLGVALMALIFYSARSDADEAAYHAADAAFEGECASQFPPSGGEATSIRPRSVIEDRHADDLLDAALAETFPASDPIAISVAREAAGARDGV